MRKFLAVAGVLAIAACGEKKAPSAEAVGAAAGAAVDTMAQQAGQAMNAAADSAKAAVNSMSDSAKVKASPADSVNRKMEKNPATPPKN